MAAIDYFLANTADSGWQRLDTSTQSAATIVGGWVVSTGSTNHSAFEQGVERAASTFTSTTPPDGTTGVTLNESFRSVAALDGSFASANWVFHFVVRAVTNGGAQDGRVRFRLLKADADGTNATEITGAQQQASIVTDVSTSADFDSTLTVNPGAFTITNQYLFVQVAWERTGAGGMTNADIDFRTGSSTSAGTRITTANFTANQTLTATAPVVTITAPTATRAATVTLPATAPVVAFSAPTATLVQGGGSQTLTAGAPVVTFSAPAAAVSTTVTLTATAPTITFSAPAATRVATVTLVAGAPTITLTAPTATLVISGGPQTLVATAPIVTFTTPHATISVSGGAGGDMGSRAVTLGIEEDGLVALGVQSRLGA